MSPELEEAWRVFVQAREKRRRCGVCMGFSPKWEGHDTNPPCEEGAFEMLQKAFDEEPRYTT